MRVSKKRERERWGRENECARVLLRSREREGRVTECGRRKL